MFVDEHQELHDAIVRGDYDAALAVLAELDEMSREDKFAKIGAFARILLIHLIKRSIEGRTTNDWDDSIADAIDAIARTNWNRNTRKNRFRPAEIEEAMEEAWPSALRKAAREAKGGRLSARELATQVDRAAIQAEAMQLIEQAKK